MGSRPTIPPLPSLAKILFFEYFVRDEDWSSAFTLLDTLETYFDSHVDILQRKLQKHSDRLEMKTEETFQEISGDQLAEDMEKEFKNFKLQLSSRMTNLAASWQSAKVVQTREKVSFFFGVMYVLSSVLFFGLAPQYVHIAYTVQAACLLPLRFYIYKKRAWHYFVFDICYYVNILNLLFIWLFPSNAALLTACYCLSHGPLASGVIMWQDSLVFHDRNKVTTLFVHIYPPFTFTVIRHFYPGAEQRFPALNKLPHLEPLNALLLSGGIYVIWQLLYWKFIFVNRREKIASGQRKTSFSWILNDKHSLIGRKLASVPPQNRQKVFMTGQLVYSMLTEIPALFFLYDSPLCSGIFLIVIFSVSMWNGGGSYIEVFRRKFERELVEALRKELADTVARSESGRSSPASTNQSLPSTMNSPDNKLQDLPINSTIPPILTDSDMSDTLEDKKHR